MISLTAPAKLTWSLRVLGQRRDGMHLLEAEMVSLDLADTIELTNAAELTDGGRDDRRLDVTFMAPAREKDVDVGGNDLVRRALEACGRGADVRLTKRIPIGAGLGGGSSDAAAVLRWAGRCETSVALSLGADVPYCCVGGRAMVRGVGDEVQPLEEVARTVTLAIPAFGVDTATCYRAYDELGPARGDPRNHLAHAAEAVVPSLGAIRRTLESSAGTAFELAGSGSTLFCEGDPLSLDGQGTVEFPSPEGQVCLLVARTVPRGV